MGAMLTRGVSAWDTLRSYLPNGHDLFKVAVAILILVAFYLLARLVRLLASKELRRVKSDPQVALLVNRIVFLTALVIGIIAAFSELFGSPALVFGGFGFLALALSLAFQHIPKHFLPRLFLARARREDAGHRHHPEHDPPGAAGPARAQRFPRALQPGDPSPTGSRPPPRGPPPPPPPPPRRPASSSPTPYSSASAGPSS